MAMRPKSYADQDLLISIPRLIDRYKSRFTVEHIES